MENMHTAETLQYEGPRLKSHLYISSALPHSKARGYQQQHKGSSSCHPRTILVRRQHAAALLEASCARSLAGITERPHFVIVLVAHHVEEAEQVFRAVCLALELVVRPGHGQY